MDVSQQLASGHGDHLDLDTHIANGSVRLVRAEHAYDWDTGEPIPVDRKTMSVITPENHPHWEDWHGVPHPETEGSFRDQWDTWQKNPEHQYKIDQIKRSCPTCSKLA